MGILLCEKKILDVWIRNKSVRAEIGHILRTHTHAAKLVVEISMWERHTWLTMRAMFLNILYFWRSDEFVLFGVCIHRTLNRSLLYRQLETFLKINNRTII